MCSRAQKWKCEDVIFAMFKNSRKKKIKTSLTVLEDVEFHPSRKPVPGNNICDLSKE